MTNAMKQKLAAGELVLCMNLRLARTVDIAMVAKAGGYRAMPLGEINERLNAETALIVMLETAEGIDNAAAIAALPGIDVLLIGSGDLTTDYGIPGQVDHPRLRAAYQRVAAACTKHRRILGVGGIRHNVKLQGELVRLGARFVIAGTDTNYVLAGARADTEALRAIPLG